MGIHRGPRIVTEGCVLALDAADRNSYSGSGTAWRDLSGTGNNCTLVGGCSYDQNNSGSILFDGSTGYGNIPHNSSISLTTGTISVWFKYSTASGNGATIISKADTSASINGFSIYLYLGTLTIAQKNASTSYVPSSATINTNTWYNVVTTFSSNSTITFYLNGNLFSSAATGTLTTNAQPIRLADSVDTYWSIMGGNISSVLMHNRVLSASEVLQNFNAMRGRFGV